MSVFVGVDYDSNGIYIAAIDEDTLELVSHVRVDLVSRGDSFDRCRLVRDRMPARSAWRDAGTLAVALELPFSRQRNSIVALSRVQGAILACLPADLLVLDLPPQEWKRVTVGKAKASKDEVRAWARDQGAPHGLVQDFYDAYALARAAAQMWTRRREIAA